MKIFTQPGTCPICGGECLGMEAGWWQVHIDSKVCIANLKKLIEDKMKEINKTKDTEK
jgi:hypothetical protein